jgi:hypothetical protein
MTFVLDVEMSNPVKKSFQTSMQHVSHPMNYLMLLLDEMPQYNHYF